MTRSQVLRRLTQHIRDGLTPLPFGTLPLATSYMLGPLSAHCGQRKEVLYVTM